MSDPYRTPGKMFNATFVARLRQLTAEGRAKRAQAHLEYLDKQYTHAEQELRKAAGDRGVTACQIRPKPSLSLYDGYAQSTAQDIATHLLSLGVAATVVESTGRPGEFYIQASWE